MIGKNLEGMFQPENNYPSLNQIINVVKRFTMSINRY